MLMTFIECLGNKKKVEGSVLMMLMNNRCVIYESSNFHGAIPSISNSNEQRTFLMFINMRESNDWWDIIKFGVNYGEM